MNTIGYIRLSEEDQSNYSISMQENGIKDYCHRNRLELVKIFIDNGESSYTFDRTEFKKLEAELKALKAEYFIVYHLDRFGRNLAEALLKVKQLFEKGIKVRDITDPLDLDDEDINTFLLRTMKFMAAESELHRIRKRTKDGIRQAAIDGRLAGMAPFGYKNERDEQDKGIIVIDDEKASLVRILFREYLNGMGIESLRKMISQYGNLPKGSSALQKILGNPIYAGMIRVPAAKNHPAKLVTGLHVPIISEQDYWLVQERLNGKKIVYQNREEVPLRQVLHCWCGKSMTAGNSKSKSGRYYWYYLCPQHRKSLPAARLHEQFNQILSHLSFNIETLKLFKEQLTERLTHFINNREANLSIVRKQLSTIENKIQIAEEKYLRKANISEAAYNKVMSEYKAERSRLYLELSKVNTNEQAYWEKLNVVLLQIANVKKAFEDMSLQKKQAFINLVFDNSLMYENGIYRTPSLHYLFSHNLNILNEKGLLKISSPVVNLGIIPLSTGQGNPIEHRDTILEDLDRLYKLFVA